jgi:hypothetical protein
VRAIIFALFVFLFLFFISTSKAETEIITQFTDWYGIIQPDGRKEIMTFAKSGNAGLRIYVDKQLITIVEPYHRNDKLNPFKLHIDGKEIPSYFDYRTVRPFSRGYKATIWFKFYTFDVPEKNTHKEEFSLRGFTKATRWLMK